MHTTSRILIRHFDISDAETFFDLTQDEGFNLFPITIYRQKSLSSATEWVTAMAKQNAATGLGKYLVIEKDTGLVLGMGGLTPWKHQDEDLIDITYRLRTSAQGKGHGLELARLLVDHGFNRLGLNEITATITPDNIASKKIAEKIGLAFDSHITLLGVPTDLYRLKRN